MTTIIQNLQASINKKTRRLLLLQKLEKWLYPLYLLAFISFFSSCFFMIIGAENFVILGVSAITFFISFLIFKLHDYLLEKISDIEKEIKKDEVQIRKSINQEKLHLIILSNNYTKPHPIKKECHEAQKNFLRLYSEFI